MSYLKSFPVLVALAVVACDNSTAPSRHSGSSLNGTNVSDTVEATLVNPLRVVVRDTSGALPPTGTVVRFNAVPNDLDGNAEALVEGFTDTAFADSAVGTTDQSGSTGVHVRFGAKAGIARIVVTIPSLGFTDTARFTVKPGTATRVIVTPGMLTVSAGQSGALTGAVVDRHGNRRDDVLKWSTSSPNVRVTQGGTVVISHYGIYTITASTGTLNGSTVVALMPQGRISALLNGSIITVNLDGSNLQTLVANVPDGGIGIHPRWMPNTNTIIYTSYDTTHGGAVQLLEKVNAIGTITPFSSSIPSYMSHEAEPSPSSDGTWVYFSAFDTRCSTQFYCLYRAQPDGTSQELLGNYIQTGVVTWRPAPSPDGSKVAFVTSGAGGATIKVFDVANKTVSSWAVDGQQPRWSPTNAQIAYLAPFTGAINIINADGTGNHRVTPAGRIYNEEQITWSPDGQLLLATANDGLLDLIDVQTGASISLSFSQGMHAPDWQ